MSEPFKSSENKQSSNHEQFEPQENNNSLESTQIEITNLLEEAQQEINNLETEQTELLAGLDEEELTDPALKAEKETLQQKLQNITIKANHFFNQFKQAIVDLAMLPIFEQPSNNFSEELLPVVDQAIANDNSYPELISELDNPINTVEQESKPKIGFYVTDHNGDLKTGNVEVDHFEEYYGDIARDGITSVRFDARWNMIQPSSDQISQEQIDRYIASQKAMRAAGLEEPTIVLSSIPDWAQELYKNGDKEAFFEAYTSYVKQVKAMLEQDPDTKVKKFQLLNEFNVASYTPIKPEDIPRMCEITRQVLYDYNPDLKLMGTVLAGNLAELKLTDPLGFEGLSTYLPKMKEIVEQGHLDSVAIDYYAGFWHLPLKNMKPEFKDGKFTLNLQNMFKDITLLKQVLEEVATWGIDYEIGEAGHPTLNPFGKDKVQAERRQRYFYDIFFRSFKHLLNDFQKRGIALPTDVGLYQAKDEEALTDEAGILATFITGLKNKIHPEHNFGMRAENEDGSLQRKLILQGNLKSSEEAQANQPSQLKNLINYVNR